MTCRTRNAAAARCSPSVVRQLLSQLLHEHRVSSCVTPPRRPVAKAVGGGRSRESTIGHHVNSGLGCEALGKAAGVVVRVCFSENANSAKSDSSL